MCHGPNPADGTDDNDAADEDTTAGGGRGSDVPWNCGMTENEGCAAGERVFRREASSSATTSSSSSAAAAAAAAVFPSRPLPPPRDPEAAE